MVGICYSSYPFGPRCGPTHRLAFEILRGELAGPFASRGHGVGDLLQHLVVGRWDRVESAQAHDLAIEKVGFDGAQAALQALPGGAQVAHTGRQRRLAGLLPRAFLEGRWRLKWNTGCPPPPLAPARAPTLH